MAELVPFPIRGLLDWDDDLQRYIDSRDTQASENLAALSTLVSNELALRYTKTASDARYATTAQGTKADSAVQPAALSAYYTATQADSRYATTAQGAKADSAVQPAGLTKTAVGLPNVDNTSDANKPVSTAQAAAILAGNNAVRFTSIAVNTDLNTLQTAGNYAVFNGTLALNFPVDGYSGDLRVSVVSAGSAVLQTFVAHSGGAHAAKVLWVRRLNGGSWSTWSPISSNKFLAAGTAGSIPGSEVYVYDPSIAAGADRQVQVIQQALGSADLNTITFAGSYVQGTNTLATLALNYPLANVYGVLDVQRLNSQNVTQTFTTIASSRAVWRRRLTSNVWEPWEQVSLVRWVDSATVGRAAYMRNANTSSEQLIYGDTGWRSVVADLTNGWTATAVLLRREGRRVSLRFAGLNGASATAVQALPGTSLPVGFRPLNPEGISLRPTDNGIPLYGTVDVSGAVSLPGNGVARTVSSGTGYYGADWITNDAWPTALPGVASGTIPNL